MQLNKCGKWFLAFGVIIFCATFVVSCKNKKRSPSGFTDDTFIDKLKEVMQPIDTAGGKKLISISDNVRFTYQSDDYQPIWIKDNYVPTEASALLIAELEDVYWDGLNTEQYNLPALKLLKEKLDTTKKNSVADAIAFDTALTHCYLAASRQLLLGIVQPKKLDSLWYHVNDTVWNAPMALVEGNSKYPSLDDYRSKVPAYTLLRNEYKLYYNLSQDTVVAQSQAGIKPVARPNEKMMDDIRFIIKTELPWLETVPNDTISEEKQLIIGYQNYAGIKRTGKLDSTTLAMLATPADTIIQKIKANMERIRWMQREFGNTYIIVDVPMMELFFMKDGTDVMHMRVVVGKPERQTPSLFATMANVVINPPWGVPPTILKNDVVPGFQKSGRQYLAKKGLKAYDKEGKEVSASRLTNSNLRNYTFKQAPGDDNSLGFVKFNLPNKWDIYLHDTPHREDFVKWFRALSSGCIRLEQPQEMALYILSEMEKKYYTQGKLDTMISTHKTRWEVLKNKIPVHIAYLTAFTDTTGAHVRFVRDVYHRDEKLIAALNK